MNWKFKGKLKYNNTPTYVDGFRFDSKAEARRYQDLKLLQQAGQVEHIDIHPRFYLAPEITYTADFMVYYKNGLIEVEDVKSPATAKKESFKIKQKLFNQLHALAPLRIIEV